MEKFLAPIRTVPHALRAATVLVILAALAGCASPTAPTSGAVDTGTFPNLNVKPAAATTQLSQEDRDAAVASLKGAAAGQAAAGKGAGATTSDAELRRLGATHSDETLKEICAPRPTC